MLLPLARLPISLDPTYSLVFSQMNPMSPRIERAWHDLVWYPPGYERNQLVINTEILLRYPILSWVEEAYQDREHQNEPWRQLAGVVPHAETLHRFTDNRWIPFEGKPLPDGSNIGTITLEDGTYKINGSPELRRTFLLYRRWLEFLHLDSLLTLDIYQNTHTNQLLIRVLDDSLIEQTLRFDFFAEVLSIAGDEKRRVDLVDDLLRQYSPDEGLSWIFHWRRGVVNQLYDMLAAAEWAADTQRDDEEDAMLEVFVFKTPASRPEI